MVFSQETLQDFELLKLLFKKSQEEDWDTFLAQIQEKLMQQDCWIKLISQKPESDPQTSNSAGKTNSFKRKTLEQDQANMGDPPANHQQCKGGGEEGAIG